MILYTKDAGGAGREQMAMQKYLTFMNRNDLITSLKVKQKNLTDSSPFSRWNMLTVWLPRTMAVTDKHDRHQGKPARTSHS